jgi:hypothetical protein
MSERDDSGKWVSAFALGVIVGILLTLGIGGVLLRTQYQRAALEAERAHMMEMMAREEAERARQAAERAAVEANLTAEKKRHEAEQKSKVKGP